LVQFAVSILLTIPHRYELVKTSMTWPAAQGYCRVNYTDLAIILSNKDWLRLNKETVRKGWKTATLWVGLWKDVNSWRWSLGDLPLQSFPYTNWYPGEPNIYFRSDGCVAMDIYARWFNEPCTQLRPFVCYN
ncbi:macrophage mannose receptor 1-like, partial [Clarias magur]